MTITWTSEEDRARIGTSLRRLRQAQDLKQEDIAKKTGIATGTVQAIEYNKYKVAVEKIEQYAAVLGTTADQLLHPKTETPPNVHTRVGARCLIDLAPILAQVNPAAVRVVEKVMRNLIAVPRPDDVCQRIAARLPRLSENEVELIDALTEYFDQLPG